MKVFFAVPTYSGIQCPEFLDSLEATINLCHEEGYETQLATIEGSCYIQAARNELVFKFMESDADVLFFLDDDISWPADAALHLLSMGCDVAAGIYPMKTDTEKYPVVINIDDNNIPVQQDCYVSGEAVPTGFLKITRDAIDQMIAAYPQQKFTEYDEGEKVREMYDLFPQGIYNGRWVGEDFAFCRLWKTLGNEIWIAPDINFGHHSTKQAWRGNYHEYLMRCQA